MTGITINTPTQYAAILLLVLFYTIYIGKMVIQLKKGIQTDQMARGKKNKALFRTEFLLKLATYSTVVVEAVSILLNTTHSLTALKIAGIILGAAGVVIFGIAVNTMRDNWRAGIPTNEKTTLVSSGIFQISRNPAFLAFDLLYLGLLLLFFNWIVLAFSFWSMFMLHLQIKQEEKFLESAFGEEYLIYKRQVGRYLRIKNTSAVLFICLVLICSCDDNHDITNEECVFIEYSVHTHGDSIEGDYIPGPWFDSRFYSLDYENGVGILSGNMNFEINKSLKFVLGSSHSFSGLAGCGVMPMLHGVYKLPYQYSDLKILSIDDLGTAKIQYNDFAITLKNNEVWKDSTSYIDTQNNNGKIAKANMILTIGIINNGMIKKSNIRRY